MNKTALALCLSLLAAPLAANAQVIDGSSDEAFKKSLLEMAEKIPEAEREDFGAAIMSLMLKRYPPALGLDGLAAFAMLPDAVEAAPRTMHGVTYEEIRAEMQEEAALRAERLAEEERLAAEGRRKADAKQDEADRSASELACLQEKVTISNLRIEPANLGRTVRADIRNDLAWAIAGIRMEVIATTPGRSVPWGKDDFVSSIPGGIEPGETREVSSTIMIYSGEMPEKLDAAGKILNVSDSQERLLVGGVTVMGWSEEPSPMSCLEASAQN